MRNLETGSYVVDLGGGSGTLIEFSHSVRNDLHIFVSILLMGC